MTIAILSIGVGLCLALIYLIKQVYLFQIKEYRFDRIRARIQDFGLLHFLFAPDIQTPSKKHPRNIVILTIGMISITLLSLIIPQTTLVGIALIVLAPVLAFCLTALGVLITSIPVSWYRRRTIANARDILTYVDPIVIGVTGSYGKTMTKDYLHTVLASQFQTVKTQRNQNTDIGIALSTIQQVRKGVQYYVVEMGAYRRGEIADIVSWARPRYAIITAIGSQHLSLFGDAENLFRAKSEIAEHLPPDGRLFVNSNINHMLKLRLAKITPCPIIEYPAVPHDPHTTATNAVKAVCHHLGISDEQIEKSLLEVVKPASISPVVHPSGYVYIDSSHTTSVDSFIAHLHTLRSVRKPNKYVLTSGIIELGSHRSEAYRRILSEMPPHTRVFTTDRAFAKVAHESRKASQVQYDGNTYRLTSHIASTLDKDSAILIEGKFRQDFVDRIIS